MKYLNAILLILIMLIPILATAQTPVSGNISGTWTRAESPYYVTDNCQVTSSLVIEAGVEVLFSGFFEIKITGSFNAVGTKEEPIKFSSLLETPASGDWNRIYFYNCGSGNNIENCIIDYATNGIFVQAFRDASTEMTISYCKISNCSEYGIYTEGLSEGRNNHAIVNAKVNNVEIFNCGGGIYGHASAPGPYTSCSGTNNSVFNHCLIRDCGSDGINWTEGVRGNTSPNFTYFTITRCGSRGIFCGEGVEAELINSIIAFNQIGIERQDASTSSVYYNNFFNDSLDFVGFPISYGSLIITNHNGDSCDVGFNILLNPEFADTSNTLLSSNSPCIDAGDPNSPLDPDNTITDMGAHYFDQGNVIPVELTYFTFTSRGNTVILNWCTTTEKNSYGFEVQRSESVEHKSLDKKWTNLGFIAGQGTSTSPNQYTFTDNTLTEPGTYYYRLKQVDFDGSFEYSQEVEFIFGAPVTFELSQNYPNPFNPQTEIRYQLPKSGNVRLIVYNHLGQKVRTLVDNQKPAGYHIVAWDGRDDNGKKVTSGIYLYKMQVGDDVLASRKMLLVK